MKLYIAGPMTHIPQFNFPAFDAMGALLRDSGYDVVSPAELDDPVDRAAALASPDGNILSYGKGVKKTWGQFLSRDVRIIADEGIEGIVVLDGWHRSRGARLETFVGNMLCNLPIARVGAMSDMGVVLEDVPKLELFRAWCSEPTLTIGHTFGLVRA